MDYRDIQKLKAFFSALKDSGFKQNLNQIPSFTMIGGQRTPVDKIYCLQLLRKFPQFQGDKFKDDNAIIKYLSDPSNRKFLPIELTKALEEKPIVAEAAGEQPGVEKPPGQEMQPAPGGEPASTMAGGIPPLMPSFPSTPVIRTIPQTPKMPSALQSAGKTLASDARIGIKKGLTRASSRFSGIFGGLGRGFGGILGGVGGGGVRFLSGAGGTLANMGTQMTRNPLIKLQTKRAVIILLLLLLPLVFLTAFAPAPGQQQPVTQLPPVIGGTCPDQATIDANKNPNSCRYLGIGVNIFDTNIPQAVIDTYINSYSNTFVSAGLGDLNEFKRRVDLIISKSQSVGLNPVLFLGYWKTESLFGTKTDAATFGCAPGQEVKPFEIELNCAVGLNPDGTGRGGSITSRCASPNNPNRTQDCTTAKSLRDNRPDLYASVPLNYPISTFDDFAESYGSRAPNLNQDGSVNNNCISTYNKLVEVVKELNACQVSIPVSPVAPPQPPPGGAAVSCPLDGRRVIGCGSFMSESRFNRGLCSGPQPIDRGHCGLTYGCYKTVNGQRVKITDPNEISSLRRAHAIDVDANPGEQVKLPFINGQSSAWFNNPSSRYGPLSAADGGGYGHVFTTDVDGSVWMVHFVHMNENVIPPPLGRGYQSGDPVVTVADTSFDHLHVNMGKDITSINGGEGWKDPESLGMCVN